MAADLDGDGTDELVLLEADTSGEAPYSTAVLTWDGSGYRIVRSDVLADTHGPTFLDAGDSDGVPGEDVLLVDMTFDKQEFLTVAQLIRLTLRGDVLVRESSPLEAPQGFAAARLLSTPEGPTILTADGEFFEFVRWPRDASVEPLSLQPGRNGVPLAVMGSGERTLLLVGAQFGEITALHVFSPFRSEWTPVSADLRAGVFASAASGQEPDATPTWTPMGPVPGGFPDSPEAFVFSGMKFVPIPGNGDQFTVDPMAVLPERRIVGTAGPGAGRTVLSSQPSFSVAESPRVVSVGFLADAGTLGLASTASILEPEIESGALKPTFHGVAPNPARPDQLIVGREAVDVEIQAPPGSQLWWTGSGGVEEATVGDDGTARIRLVEAAGESVRDGRRVTRRIWLVTPVGHTYLGSWVISVYRQPPDLGIEDEVPLFDFDPVLVGETLAGSTMTLNGDPVPVAADGSFSVPIDIGVVPTEIRIVVTDPVGNQTERLITRVWPLDYRQLPWVPIVVFVLLMVAGLLYVYEPDSAPRRRVSQDEDSTFEEIGG
jgi:hypothetical protein